MAKDTWNFPCHQPIDKGTGNVRNDNGFVFEVGPGGFWTGFSGSTPFTDTVTAIFSVLIRSGWTSQDGGIQGIFSLGHKNIFTDVFSTSFVNSDTTPRIRLYSSSPPTIRYEIFVGDEDGINWLQDDKWYQIGVSIDPTSISYCVNGVTNPTVIESTNSPGSIAVTTGGERIWYPAPSAGSSQSDPLFVHTGYSSLVMGAAAYTNQKLDFSDAVVRNRIWDISGDFKNPGENGSLWFSDTYDTSSGYMPNYFMCNGQPFETFQKGSDVEIWAGVDGGNSGVTAAPGGLRKQYES